MVSVITDGGGDYPSLAQAIAGEGGTTGDLVIQCAGVLADTSASNVAGMAASSIVIESDPVHAAGLYTGSDYWSSSHYRIEHAGGDPAIDIGNANVTIRGIQARKTGTTSALIRTTANGSRFDGIRIDQQINGHGINCNGAIIVDEVCNCILTGSAAMLSKGLVRTNNGADITHVRNNLFREVTDNSSGALYFNGSETVTNYFNNKNLNNATDIRYGSGTITNSGSNATSKATSTAVDITIEGIATPADYVSATDFRPKLGGKLFRTGSRADIPRPNDITGSPWEWPNVGPFSEFVADAIVTVNTDNVGPPDYPSLALAIAGEQGQSGGLHIECAGIQADVDDPNITGLAASGLLIEGSSGPTGRYTGTEDFSTQHYRLDIRRTLPQQSSLAFRGIQFLFDDNGWGIQFRGTGCLMDGCRAIDIQTASNGVVRASNGGIVDLYSTIVSHPGGSGSAVRSFTDSKIGAVVNCTIVGSSLAGGGIGLNADGDPTDAVYNTQFIGFGTPCAGTVLASSKNAADNSSGTHIEIFDITTPADYASATDFRSVDGGKLDLDGDASQLPLVDITGVPFVNANVSPFNEIFVSGPAPSGGYSYGYMVG